jgi:hypothetical protein
MSQGYEIVIRQDEVAVEQRERAEDRKNVNRVKRYGFNYLYRKMRNK